MNEKTPSLQQKPGARYDQAGQTMVLIVFMLIGLLAFAGIAVDTGFLFVRSSQFAAAVDAAALAGVVDLQPGIGNVNAADTRAQQFLAANGWPTDTISTMVSTQTISVQGIPQYALTVTWPVEMYFLRIVGFEEVPVTRAATAAYYAQSDIYTPSAAERGHLRKASQFVFGPNACTRDGDPVSPLQSTPGTPNEDYVLAEGVYRYRIRVPDTYLADVGSTLRVELFDPDSYNGNGGNSATVTHSDSDGGGSETLSCTTLGDGDSCVIATGESNAANQNPFWYVRVDENYDSSCNNAFGNPNGDTVTVYELFYYDDNDDRVSLAKYTANNAHLTDMKWVAPGVTAGVPADAGTFDVDVSGIPQNEAGDRHVYLDVTASAGSAKNVWDLWAGPPPFYFATPLAENVNERNLQLANNPASYDPERVAVFAVGRMPVQHHQSNEIVLPLAPVDAIKGGGTIYISIFDHDNGATAPTFTMDTVSPAQFSIPMIITPNPDPDSYETACNNTTNCDNAWTRPQLRVGIPTEHFFGGTMQATYTPAGDAHTWYFAITSGRPFLTK